MRCVRSPLLPALLVALSCLAPSAHAQVGTLIWQDEFNGLGNWLKITGNGSWGWGNGELQYYRNENVSIAPIAEEPGNNALHIVAKRESGPGITDQWGNPLQYTSGKVSSRSFVSVRYGMIETRVRVPDLRVGGWPAFWMLGTATVDWPASGEVDFMEMGAAKAFRDLHDTHNGGDGLDASTENDMVGANAIWYSAAAVTPGNPSGAASLAYDPSDLRCRPYYNRAQPLAGRFLVYRLYWDPNSMRMTVVDNGVERDLYTTPFTITADADEFRQPFYFIANLAIGGAYTDAYRLGAPASGLPISMPLPAAMDVDYVRVYRWNGYGEVTLGPPTAQNGRYGLYTDTTPTTASLTPGVDGDVYVWGNTLVAGTTPPFEGGNVLAWRTNAQGWFGAGIMSRQPLNLFGFGAGNLKFRIRIPANVTFKVGIIDVWGNQSYVELPANVTKYGLVRNGQWGQVSIPVSEIRGTAMDLRMLSYSFVVLEQNGTPCEFAVDDVYWDSGVVTGVEGGGARIDVGRLASAPNPFVGLTELRFTLVADAPYELAVYDAAGQRVSSLRGLGRAGENRVRWSGHGDDGRRLAPGVYHCRLVSGAGSETRRVVLLQ